MTPQDFESFPVFGDNSSKVQPDDPKYVAGFVPGDVLPAEWLNWFLNTGTKGYNELVQHANEGFTLTISGNTTLTPTKNMSVVIDTPSAVLTLGNGPYVGYFLKIMAAANCSVSYTGSGGSSADTLAAGQIAGYIWNGSYWKIMTVTPDGTQTLTNKTISYAHNTLTGVQPTLTAGPGIDITGTTIKSKIVYSTSEVKTGDVWTDGKPIYMRTFTGTTPATAYSYTNIISIPNGYYIIDYFGEVGNLPINAIRPASDSTINSVYTAWVTRNGGTGLDIVCGSNTTNRTYVITVFYTKTTD